MSTFLFCWAGFSVLICLALLRAAARQRPRVETENLPLPQHVRRVEPASASPSRSELKPAEAEALQIPCSAR